MNICLHLRRLEGKNYNNIKSEVVKKVEKSIENHLSKLIYSYDINRQTFWMKIRLKIQLKYGLAYWFRIPLKLFINTSCNESNPLPPQFVH